MDHLTDRSRIKTILVFLLVLSVIFSGCKKTSTKTESQSSTKEEFTLESLAGESFLLTGGTGSAAMINISKDGKFKGSFRDSRMEDSGVDYDGTVYYSGFNGEFGEPQMITEYIYTMEVNSIETEVSPGEEIIEDSVKYISTEPFGMDINSSITVYLPGADISDAPAEFISFAKSGYYFEGNIIPVMAFMTEQNGSVFGWMQQPR